VPKSGNIRSLVACPTIHGREPGMALKAGPARSKAKREEGHERAGLQVQPVLGSDPQAKDCRRSREIPTSGTSTATDCFQNRQQPLSLGGGNRSSCPECYTKPFVKGQKNDYNDAEAVAEAALRPNLRVVQEKSQNQLDLQACHRVRSRLVSRRTATINQIRAFLIEQGLAVRAGARALRKSLFAILKNRTDEISPRMANLIRGLYEDWCCLDERIETVTREIEELSRVEPKCQRLMSVPGIGPLISTALVAAIGTGEAFDRGRDLGAWLGLVPRQYSTGGRSILGRISKRGSRYLRMLLVQAARVLLMRPHTWSRFSFGAWLRTASERLHRHKLAIALANKLARIAWSVLRHDKAFDTHLEIAAI
jgi:transposase